MNNYEILSSTANNNILYNRFQSTAMEVLEIANVKLEQEDYKTAIVYYKKALSKLIENQPKKTPNYIDFINKQLKL